MRIAIITGASSGLGREFALHADKNQKFDSIWVIARRTERLEALAAECLTPVRIIPLDLSDKESIKQLSALLEEAAKDNQKKGNDSEGFSVGLLVNAAGLGKFGTYRDISQEEVDAMIDINCRAAVDITQVAITYMERGSRIIEVASCAGFQPLPGLNVYAATKAFLLSYTRSLRWELSGTGIHATALCPLWMKTEFIETARDTANGTTVRHPFPLISAKRAVTWSSFINACNLPVATGSVITFAQRILAKIIPNPLLMAAWEGIRRI